MEYDFGRRKGEANEQGKHSEAQIIAASKRWRPAGRQKRWLHRRIIDFQKGIWRAEYSGPIWAKEPWQGWRPKRAWERLFCNLKPHQVS